MLNEYSKNINNINYEKNINYLKDILIPPIKEIEARNLVNYYIKNFKEKNNNNDQNINNNNNNLIKKNTNKDIEHSTIYDYSFMNEKYLKKNIKKKEKRKSYKKKNEKSIYERDIEKQKEKEKKLELLRKEEEKKNYKEIQNKPNIYEKSKKIIKNNLEPVYIRLNNNKKNNNIIIENNEYKSNKKFNEKEFNYWLKLNTTREQMKRAKLNYIKKEIEENNKLINENIENNLIFKPKINENSKKICDIKYNNKFENRLIEYQNEKNQKLQQIYKENTPSFIPKINEFFFS